MLLTYFIISRQLTGGATADINMDNEEPPDNFRDIQIFPQRGDMQVSQQLLQVCNYADICHIVNNYVFNTLCLLTLLSK